VSKFRVVGETTRAASAFLELVDVEVESADGERFSRSVVRHPGAVIVVPVDDDGAHVFFVRQYRASVDREVLEVPAGKRDVAGEAPEATAVRELEEEIGRSPNRLVKLCECLTSPGFTDEYSHIYLALDLTDAATSHPTRHEEAEMTLERVALDDVDHLIATGELIDATSILGLELARRFLAGEYPGMAG
jgi:8-oxo-dGTP pyrophosphatase MutT (NUDIX family)